MTRLFVLCLVLTAGNIFAGGKPQAASNATPTDFQDELREAALPPEQPPPGRAEQVMKALVAAYPQRIEKAEFRNGDWAVLMRDNWYYYAGGRLLPEELLYRAADFVPQAFYNYLSELPPWKEPSPEESARLREMTKNRTYSPTKRSQHFFDDLWRAHGRDESYDRLKTIRFLGKSVMVHYAILEDLSLVEERILAEAKTDSQVRSWINNISTIDCWSWRNIADTQTRSYHAYGVAIDILPKSLGGKETYWLWASNKRPEWWRVSYNERFHPPAAVIKAFEAYGFVWGGKWQFYDTMHFEYRPEILILSGMGLTGLR